MGGKACVRKPTQWKTRPSLRNFYLFDNNKNKVKLLKKLKAAQPDDPHRIIKVKEGDFNILVHQLLASGVVKKKEATFCLLDQRTFECHWNTVKALAEHKKEGYKIELFYFLANGWLDRALAGQRDKQVLVQWWGGTGWQVLRNLDQRQRGEFFAKRFKSELGYASSKPWAIFRKKGCIT